METGEKHIKAQAEELQNKILEPPKVAEAILEQFVDIEGGKIHRQSSRHHGLPPEFWATTCGKLFAGSVFTFKSACQVIASKKDVCAKCVPPTRAAAGQVGAILGHASNVGPNLIVSG